MRVWRLTGYDGPDSLVLGDEPAPGPVGPGQIRVAMRAASINYRDVITARGDLAGIVLPDLVLGSDGAGEVVEIGAEVRRVKVGDRIALTFNPDWIGGPFRASAGAVGRGGSSHGTMRDEMVVGEHEAVVLPEHLSFEEGATLPCAAVTAWHALCGAAPLLPGSTVLTQGGGGVSIFALQFAKLFGARVIVTTSGPDRAARLRDLGADETIDRTANPDWNLAVRELTGGQGADLTLEIGGAATIARSLGSTRAGGRLAVIGLLSGRPDAASVFSSGVDIAMIKVGSRDDFEAMNRAIDFHALRPVIDSRYPIEQLPQALRHLAGGTQFGKIVFTF